MMIIRALALVAVLASTACATLPAPEQPPQPPPGASDNTAVVALAQNARADMSAGRLEMAAANLERALRIEPRNPALWHELARVALHQGRPADAAEFASKSNTFAGNNTVLRGANWRLIGQARTQNGDHAGAEAAFERAAQIERQR